ncbi:unnamed protein product [Rhizoctonia solani]|uniref:Phosphatidylglycerophosphatase GEP4, mitochondrial n=1 Tax=Rhizoctonia solani TaxID=456999 RepID=A0A8H3EBH9_9AGAM|nr:unnamed protein product [Rhizoctonia solani]
MPNLHGSVFALRALLRPGLLVPSIKVDTIARLDFAALKQAGYTGAVFDRDNCLTVPHGDSLVPELVASPDAWARCKSAFGRKNMLIVSNSAGTSDDPLGIQAESLAYNLGVPVFRHKYKKPACGEEIVQYFRHKQNISKLSEPAQLTSRPRGEDSRPPNLNDQFDPTIDTVSDSPKAELVKISPAETPRLLIVGDRLLTDILLSTTLPSPSDHLPIWTTRLWKTPDLSLLRFIEQTALRLVLWHRNQVFRDGVIEQRARGETWLGKEGWLWWTRRCVLRVIRREAVPPEPIPPPANPIAKFVMSPPVAVPWRPTTRLGWTWYYSKILAKYAGKGSWVTIVWVWIGVRTAVSRAWRLASRKIGETKAKRAVDSQSAQVKSP